MTNAGIVPLLLAAGLAACAPGAKAVPEPILIGFLEPATNALLNACAAGDAASCDAARAASGMDDGTFSHIHLECRSGSRAYCDLLDNLVASELRTERGGN